LVFFRSFAISLSSVILYLQPNTQSIDYKDNSRDILQCLQEGHVSTHFYTLIQINCVSQIILPMPLKEVYVDT
jgi:hypothetical protein